MAALAIGQQSELAEALEAARENMQQEATNELVSFESHGSLLMAMGIVFPAKSNVAVFKSEQAVIGDGDAVGVAPEISQDLFWSTEGRLGIDPPLARPETGDQSLEGEWLGQAGAGAMKG